jgi:hypothetical protein
MHDRTEEDVSRSLSLQGVLKGAFWLYGCGVGHIRDLIYVHFEQSASGVKSELVPQREVQFASEIHHQLNR